MRFALPLLCLVTTPALAATPDPMPLTYATFEASVPHIDLETCPGTMARDDIFCRATLAGDAIHVFAFSYAGDSPLVGFSSFEADALAGLLN